MTKRDTFEALRTRLSTEGEGLPGRAACLHLELESLDAALPGGGFGAGVHEVWPGRSDPSSEAASVLFAAYTLASGRGTVLWTLRRRDLFAPALAEAGLGPDRVIYAEAGDEASVLAVAEEGLRYGGLAGVVAETAKLSLKASRRLQLAAEETGTPCFVLRRLRPGQAPGNTSCLTRWAVTVLPSRAEHGLPRASWQIEMTRCRGGAPASWHVEADGDAPHRLRLASPLAARPVVSNRGRQAA